MEPNSNPNPDPADNTTPLESPPPPAPPIPPAPSPAGVGQVFVGGFEASGPSGGEPAVAPAVAPEVAPAAMPAMPPASPKRSFKPFLIALAALLIIGVGSAAAYIGIIVPNKPENILKKAIVNSLQENHASAKGTFETTPASGSGISAKATFSGAADSATKVAQAQVNLTVSGVTFPVETRLVNKNVYVKVGDLTTIVGLINGFSPEAGNLAKAVSSQLSNKWIVFDSTLIGQADGNCFLDTSWTLTKDDIKLLQDQYSKHPFTTIKSTSDETVNGQAAKKFVLSINDDKATTYGNSLGSLSIAKAFQKCDKNKMMTKNPSVGDHDRTPLTVWVDKGSKRIIQIASESTSQDAKKDNVKAKFSATISYGAVSVSAPKNAKPAMQVLADIQTAAKTDPSLLNMFGGGSTSSGNSLLQ